MYPDEEFKLDNVMIMFDGKVIGNVKSIEATISLSDGEITEGFNLPKSIEGTLDIDYIDEKLFEDLGLYEYQKTLLRRELQRYRMESTKKKKLGLRESMNNHLKRGKKW